MAFKRYIHKHGKKLGPYYYENVRSNDGRVKSVYLGTNPSHHPKHRIRKPLFFIIIVLLLILILGGSLFLLQNKSYLIKKVQQPPDFDIDQILLKVLIRSGEFIEKQARIMNTGNEPAAININILGLSDIVKPDSNYFTIKPGQTKVVGLNFSSVVPEQKIEQQPGVYVGKLIVSSEKGSKEIPMVAEIETKNVLFDMNLNPVAIERKVKQGTDTTIEVRLFNLESIESANVNVEYFVKDINGNTIMTEGETVVVKTQASFFKTISIPKNLKPGTYVFAAQAKFGNSIGTASYLFEVIGQESEEASFVQFCKNSILCLGLSFTTILLLFALTAYFYFFIGAYLYEKVTGVVAFPKKKREEPEKAEGTGFFAGLKSSIAGWRIEKARKKAEREELERRQEVSQLEAETKAKRNLGGEISDEEEQPEKKGIKELLHKIGLFKTPEEKEQIELLKEKERQKAEEEKREQEKRKALEEEGGKLEEQRKEELLRKQQELQRQREEYIKRKLGEEKRSKEEYLKKQKELESKKAEEEKRRKQLEEERIRLEEQRKEEELKRQKELEKQRQCQLKEQNLALASQIEEKLRKNREAAEQLRQELKKLESEKRTLTSSDNDVEARIRRIDNEIIEKSRHNEELSLQKKSLLEKYQKRLDELAKKQEAGKGSRGAKKKELGEKHAEKQESLVKELEDELSKLPPEKRKSTEKWKRLELKAKLKLEEQNIEEELKRYGSAVPDEKKAVDDAYKKSLGETANKQNGLKKEISALESQKQNVLLEKKNIPRGILSKENEIQKLVMKLESLAKEKEALDAELSKIKAELSGFNLGFIKNIISGYGQRLEKIRKEKEEKRARLESEKIKDRERTKKEEELEEKAKNIEEEAKRREEERKAKEGRKRKELEDKIRLQEEKKRRKELEKQKAEEEGGKLVEARKEEIYKKPEEKKPNIFSRLFGKKHEEAEEKTEELAEEIPEETGQKKSKPKSEAEELEEAIRSLDLFKKVEKGKSVKEEVKKGGLLGRFFKKENQPEVMHEEPKPIKTAPTAKKKEEKPAENKEKAEKGKEEKLKLAGKSKKFEKCHNALYDAEKAIAKNDKPKAKKLYVEARDIYVNLDYKEKKEIYGNLMELYNKLK